MSDNIAFILGGGPRIGHSVAKAFLNEGYKVALGRRDTKASEDLAELDGLILVSVDVAKPDTVRDAFEEVTSKFGAPPNVVIYNGSYSEAWKKVKAQCLTSFDSQRPRLPCRTKATHSA